MRRAKLRAAVIGVIVIAATTSVALSGANAQSTSPRAASPCAGLSGGINVFYSYNYVFNSVDLAKKWWSNIAKEWKAKCPNVAHPQVPKTTSRTSWTQW